MPPKGSLFHKRKYGSFNDHQNQKNRNRKIRRTEKKLNIVDPLSIVASSPDILPDVANCKFCDAQRIYGEPPGFCCSSGKVKLEEIEMPLELVELYTGNSEDAKHFRDCVRSYNNMFAFTSLGVHSDKSLARRNRGIYTFRVQDQLYHFMDSLIPSTGEKPKNLQLYFYDTEHEVSNRISISSDKFRENVVKKLMHILRVNPYAIFFRNLNNVENLPEWKIALHANPTFNNNIFNKPYVSQVAGIWLESNENEQIIGQHIQVYPKNKKRDDKPQVIQQYFGCYDPLQYPLIFPDGHPGWHRSIKKINMVGEDMVTSRSCAGESIRHIENYTDVEDFIDDEMKGARKKKRDTVSCREYYCYNFQVRQHD
ncbi:OLC1v1019448C1 [Oldenlandia corymbosa var. corymbosa]|uniref:OLC1v1019448C1 n=1 Tax=Oldenlandia corymbosa var. corymbosa TaxID=529605 RepID=A0AAV1EE40_OLDCO|nr:OLC1v1019448C1 [Oldenlandia corymbosa var. corymbosa]